MNSTLLTAMAYDCFVAICHPLHYTVIMNPHLCGFLVLMFFNPHFGFPATQFDYITTYFKNVEISNFFCDSSQLLNLACSDTSTNNIVVYFVGAVSGFLPVIGIFFSYCKIISSIPRVPSSGGRYETFSTCGSHLSLVCLFYGTGLGTYFSSALSLSPRRVWWLLMLWTPDCWNLSSTTWQTGTSRVPCGGSSAKQSNINISAIYLENQLEMIWKQDI